MRLLFDQNLSRTLVTRIANLFPHSAHIMQLGLSEADDAVIWDYAKGDDWVIVSKDDDFHQRGFLFGHPPKVIILGLGNCSTDLVEQVLREHAEMIRQFSRDDASVLVIP